MRIVFISLFLFTLLASVAPVEAASLRDCRNMCQPKCRSACVVIFSKRVDPDSYYACIGACVEKCVDNCADD